MRKAKGMKIEMSRVAFVELFKKFEAACSPTSIAQAASMYGVKSSGFVNDIPMFAAQDFIDRNRKKFNKVSLVQDEVIQFPQGTIVRFKADEAGRTNDPNEYVIVRAKRKIDGKREYWLSELRHFATLGNGNKPNVDRKVGGKNLTISGSGTAFNAQQAAILLKISQLKMPRPF